MLQLHTQTELKFHVVVVCCVFFDVGELLLHRKWRYPYRIFTALSPHQRYFAFQTILVLSCNRAGATTTTLLGGVQGWHPQSDTDW